MCKVKSCGGILNSEIFRIFLGKYMRQSIPEWTKYNLWKTAFTKFECLKKHTTSNFLKAVFHRFPVLTSKLLADSRQLFSQKSPS